MNIKKGIFAMILIAGIPFFMLGIFPAIARAYASPGKPSGFVNDFANVIPADQKSQIETILSNYEQQSGNEIAVATVPSLGDEDIDSYAVDLFQDWGIGQKGKDNGILLLVAPTEHEVRIEVGYGLEGDITDAQSSSIIRNILTPAFKSGDYAGGIQQAVTAIIGTLNGQVDATQATSTDATSDSSGSADNWIFFGIIILLWLLSIFGRSRGWWFIPIFFGGGRGGGFGGGGGGFGGFGGGRSGGGGASGGW